MATSLVHEDRIQVLREGDEGGGHVLYWMQRAQRTEHNDALEHAVREANARDLPLHVVFGLTADYPEASRRHYRFMLQGLAEVAHALARRSIPFAVREGHPPDVAAEAADGAALVVVDRAYQRHLVAWRRDLADAVDCRVEQVEADVCVPVEVASDKREYAARTIRPKLHEPLDDLLVELDTTALDHGGEPLAGLDLGDPSAPDSGDVEALLDELGLDDTMAPGILDGGTAQARAHLDRFLETGLAGYAERSPDPVDPGVSYLSAYLHYGQVSPVAVVLAVRGSSNGTNDDRDAYVEELVVRRELSANYVHFEPDYDAFAALPDWARTTLAEHADDEREHIYTADELEAGETHDEAWNACMAQVREQGYLHNHLRMYWGKQLMRWTNTPEYAFRVLLDLNNRYFLDGRDCSSYANVAWCFGLHDQAFGERDVTGKTRPMTFGGLKRKIDLDAWLDHVAETTSFERTPAD